MSTAFRDGYDVGANAALIDVDCAIRFAEACAAVHFEDKPCVPRK